jgi:hypothetical protein
MLLLKTSVSNHSRNWRWNAAWRTTLIGVFLYFSRAPPPYSSIFTHIMHAVLLLRNLPVARSSDRENSAHKRTSDRQIKEYLKMPIFPCRLYQPVHLGEYFTITPISFNDGIVNLQVVPSRGDRLMRAERFLQMLDEAWAQEEIPSLQTSNSKQTSINLDDSLDKDAE